MKTIRIVISALTMSAYLCLTSMPVMADEALDQQLLRAVNLNDSKEAGALLAKGANPNFAVFNTQLLSRAAEMGYAPIVQLLIDAKADLNALDDNGESAVMRAARSEKAEALSVLVKAKANLDTQNARGESALIMAATNNSPEMVKALVEGGANASLETTDGNTAVMASAMTNSPESAEIVSILAKAKADLNRGDGMNTPLTYAVLQNNSALVKALLDGGADPNFTVENGSTPLAVAFENSSGEAIVSALLHAKANPNITTSSGKTPLHIAAENGLVGETEALLKAGADINATDYSGDTPLLTAQRNEQSKVAELLSKAKS